jgi:hypothetical protein
MGDIIPTVKIERKEKNLVIRVLLVGYSGGSNLAAKLWAKQRKKVREQFNLDICLTFPTPVPKGKNELSCDFIRNAAHNEKVKSQSLAYDSFFLDTAEVWLEDFRAVLEKAEEDLLQGNSEDEILNSYFPKKTKEPKKKAAKKPAK